MAVKIEQAGGVMTAYLSGEIDHHTARGFRETIDGAAEASTPETLILDFGGITFMDSSGIGIVMGRYKLMQSLGGTLKVENASRSISRVMKLAGLDRLSVIK